MKVITTYECEDSDEAIDALFVFSKRLNGEPYINCYNPVTDKLVEVDKENVHQYGAGNKLVVTMTI